MKMNGNEVACWLHSMRIQICPSTYPLLLLTNMWVPQRILPTNYNNRNNNFNRFKF